MNICYLIPARYQSSRLPGKPLLKINNTSIISLVYNQVKKCKFKGDIYVTTDDNRIINEVGKDNCIEVNQKCLNGTERICYALGKINKKYDLVVNVQGDEPFIDPINIDLAIEKHIEFKNEDRLVCTTIHNKMNLDNVLNKNVGKLILDTNNNILYCSRSMIPGNKEGKVNINNVYNEHIGVFVFNYSYLDIYLNTPNTPLMIEEDIEWLKIIESGYKIKSFQINGVHEIGINTEEDYKYLLKKYES